MGFDGDCLEGRGVGAEGGGLVGEVVVDKVRGVVVGWCGGRLP